MAVHPCTARENPDRRTSPDTSRLLRYALLVMAVLGCHLAPADPLDRSWFEYRSQNFVVLSDVAEADVRARIDDLELFRAVVLKVTNVRAGPSGIPVEVYLFSNRADFRSTTTSDDIAGYMIPGLRVQYMASGPDMFQLNSQQVLFHEYVHYLVRNGGAAAVQPPWYDEGLADMLASTELRPDKVVLGGDFPARIQSINAVVRLPLRDVVEARRIPQTNIYARANYYGLAFAFVNYLHVARFAGARDRLPQLQTYLRLVSNARPSAALFEQAFGTDYAHMDRELTHFLGRATRPVLQLPRSLFNHDASYRRRAVGRQEIAYRLGYLTLLQAPQNAARLFQLDGLPARDARFRAGIGVV